MLRRKQNTVTACSEWKMLEHWFALAPPTHTLTLQRQNSCSYYNTVCLSQDNKLTLVLWGLSEDVSRETLEISTWTELKQKPEFSTSSPNDSSWTFNMAQMDDVPPWNKQQDLNKQRSKVFWWFTDGGTVFCWGFFFCRLCRAAADSSVFHFQSKIMSLFMLQYFFSLKPVFLGWGSVFLALWPKLTSCKSCLFPSQRLPSVCLLLVLLFSRLPPVFLHHLHIFAHLSNTHQ